MVPLQPHSTTDSKRNFKMRHTGVDHSKILFQIGFWDSGKGKVGEAGLMLGWVTPVTCVSFRWDDSSPKCGKCHKHITTYHYNNPYASLLTNTGHSMICFLNAAVIMTTLHAAQYRCCYDHIRHPGDPSTDFPTNKRTLVTMVIYCIYVWACFPGGDLIWLYGALD